MDDVPSIGFNGFKKKYKVSIRQYTRYKGYWVETKIIFSGKDAVYLYKLIKIQRFDWSLLKFDERSLSLSRFDLCFSRPNDLNQTIVNHAKPEPDKYSYFKCFRWYCFL